MNIPKDLIEHVLFPLADIEKTEVRHIAKELGVNSRLGDTNDEQKGIDGYINEIPVQIKADTYVQSKFQERFDKDIVMITYHKDPRTKDITFSYDPEDFNKPQEL